MSRTCDVWMAESDHHKLMGHLFPGDYDEHGAILRCGVVEADNRLRLVVRNVELASEQDYGPGQHGYRALGTNFIHHNIMACRNERLAYLAVHNHGGDDRVGFSAVDLESHVRGYPALLDIGRGIPVGALVFAPRAVEADVWLSDGSRASLGEFRVIGSAVRRYYSCPQVASATAPELDRQVRMFGTSGQALLGKTRAAVIGLGGIGSLVSEYLARLGVGSLLLIDPDRIEATNLSRVIGACPADVRARRLKVEIAARVAREARAGIDLTCLADDVADCSVAATLTGCDVIFLAADSMRARLVVNAIAHQYFVPVIQLGAKVRADEKDGLIEAMSVVRHVRPGSGCLWCNELIDPGQLAIEAKSDEERKAQAYGTNEPNPSVITLNAVAAAQGVNDFLFDYLGLRGESEIRFEHNHFLTRKVRRIAAGHTSGCPECERRYGKGDAMPLPCVSGQAPSNGSPSWLGRILGRLRVRLPPRR